MSYECKTCGCLRSQESFSKTQLNKLQYGKIPSMKCSPCSEAELLEISLKKRMGSVMDATETTATAAVSAASTSKQIYQCPENFKQNGQQQHSLEQQQPKKKRKLCSSGGDNSDPSLQYIDHPCDTPLIVQARKFAAAHNCKYRVHLQKTTGWRTVVKMAVRAVETAVATVKLKGSSSSKPVSAALTVCTTVGLFKPGSHQVLPCMYSEAHHPLINATLAVVEAARTAAAVEGYIEGAGDDLQYCQKHNSFLKYIVLVLARPQGKNTSTSSSCISSAGTKKRRECSSRHISECTSDDRSSSSSSNISSTGAVQVSLVWNDKPNCSSEHSATLLANFVRAIKEHSTSAYVNSSDAAALQPPLIHSIWVNFNLSSKHCNAITGRAADSWQLQCGPQWIEERIVTDMVDAPALYFPPFVFRQANICAFTRIIQHIRNWIRTIPLAESTTATAAIDAATVSSVKAAAVEAQKKSKKRKLAATAATAVDTDEPTAFNIEPKTVATAAGRGDVRCVELYGGVGTIGLNCLDLLQSLSCSDENPHNARCFERSCNGLSQSLRQRVAAYCAMSAAAVASSGAMRGYDLVLVDPPRKGLDDEVIDALTRWQTPIATTSASSNAASTSPAAVATACVGKKTYFSSVDDESSRSSNISSNFIDSSSSSSLSESSRYHRRLIYVSCGFKAFQRDASRLLGEQPQNAPLRSSGGSNWSPASTFNSVHTDSNNSDCSNKGNSGNHGCGNSGRLYWQLVHLEGHVLFPGSDHVETLAIFDRLPPPPQL